MPKVKMPDGAIVEMPDKISPEQAERLRRIQQGQAAPAAQAEAPAATQLDWADVPGMAAKNFIPSMGRTVKGIYEAVTSPVQTFQDLSEVLAGGAQAAAKKFGLGKEYDRELSPEEIFGIAAEKKGIPLPDPADPPPPRKVVSESSQAYVPKFKAFKEVAIDPYLDSEKFKHMVSENPVQPLMDLSGLLDIAGKLAKVGGAAKAGKALGVASEFTNPIAVAGKGIKVVSKPIMEVAAGGLGITTGAGSETIRAAGRGGKAFRSALRGKTSELDAVEAVRGAYGDLKKKRSKTYRSQLKDTMSAGPGLTDNPAVKTLNKLIGPEEFNIKAFRDKKTGRLKWDFSRSNLDRSTWAGMSELFTDIVDWDDFSPRGMDRLKQRIGDYHAPSKNSSAITTQLYDSVRNELAAKVPGYKKLVGDYEEFSNRIGEAESALSLGKKYNADTILRKLNTMMRENQDFRRSIVKQLEGVSEKDLRGMIAGSAMRHVVPGNKLLPAIVGSAGASAAVSTGNPAIMLLLSLSSPRLVGEFVSLIGDTALSADKLASPTNVSALYQASKSRQPEEKGQKQGRFDALLKMFKEGMSY